MGRLAVDGADGGLLAGRRRGVSHLARLDRRADGRDDGAGAHAGTPAAVGAHPTAGCGRRACRAYCRAYIAGRAGWMSIVRTGAPSFIRPCRLRALFLLLSAARRLLRRRPAPWSSDGAVCGRHRARNARAVHRGANARRRNAVHGAQDVLPAHLSSGGGRRARDGVRRARDQPPAWWRVPSVATDAVRRLGPRRDHRCARRSKAGRGRLSRSPRSPQSLSLAGAWARDHVPVSCVDYLVGEPPTAYWLHLAALGNPRMSARTGDDSTFDKTAAIIRWLTPGGLPYAIAELPALPSDVRADFDIVADFGTAAVVKRRGPSSCP